MGEGGEGGLCTKGLERGTPDRPRDAAARRNEISSLPCCCPRCLYFPGRTVTRLTHLTSLTSAKHHPPTHAPLAPPLHQQPQCRTTSYFPGEALRGEARRGEAALVCRTP